MAAGFELGEVIAEGSGYQDREAKRPNMEGVRARARTYLVPEQTTLPRKAQLRRAADREYRVLHHLRECPGVLQVTGYDDAAPLGPTVLFDDFNGAVPLDVFLRANENLDFTDRVLLVEQIARTLAACHDREVTHGALSPAAVLVRNWGRFETRLFNFQLSSGQQVDSTIHWSALADDPWVLYQAPELRQSPTKRGPLSDIFSLGALAFLILTGKPPGKDLQDIEATLHRDGAVDPRRISADIPKEAADAIVFATETKTISRADSVAGWLYIFLDAATSPPQEEAFADPLLARKGDMLSKDLRVTGELGSGASSRVLAVERDGRKYALKVSLDSEQDARLKAEADVLRKLAQAPVATLQDELELQGRTCLLLTLAGSMTLQRFLAAEGSASADLAARYGKDLLDALEELEALGITHRDIKPANIGVGSLGHGRKRLILFDFSLAGSRVSSVGIGTAVYKDPYLAERGAWDAAADRWSAAVTLHELLTGIRPHYETPKYVDDQGHEVPADLDAAPTDKYAVLTLAAERFDSQLRDALTAFFTTAFAPAIEQRFTDAAQMRRRWEACFDPETQVLSQPRAAEEPAPTQPAANKLTPAEQLSDAEIAKISADAAIASLPLTGRAKNALDRMGLLTGRDLLTLPENRLSVARGVGRTVAKEIVDFVNRWRALRPMAAAAGPAYFPNYRGEDTLLTQSELS
ncbi:MAG: protein kinase, partial [Myxococcales bacterium]|nr:protein kinase [Myxococcales bacterium]